MMLSPAITPGRHGESKVLCCLRVFLLEPGADHAAEEEEKPIEPVEGPGQTQAGRREDPDFARFGSHT